MSIDTPLSVLKNWIESRISDEAKKWLEERVTKLERESKERDLYIGFSMVPRKVGKADLKLSAEDLALAQKVKKGWDPTNWSLDQAVRLFLLLSLPVSDPDKFSYLLEQLCQTGDVGELVCLYQGLPLYPWPETHLTRATEGVRTNMQAVFDAVAHRNPYPQEFFPENAWNQMVLKAIFINRPLYMIQGLEARANLALSEMLVDYAHERWAAKRTINIELWRCIGKKATTSMLNDFQRLLETGTTTEKKAAVLALRACSLDGAKELLTSVEELNQEAEKNEFNWDTLSIELKG